MVQNTDKITSLKKAKNKYLAFFDPLWWWQMFWPIRGAIAAFFVLTLLEQAAMLPLRDVLTFVHSIVTGWEFFADRIGRVIGKIPFIPELSQETVSALGFISVIVVPAIFGLVKQVKLRFKNEYFAVGFGILGFVGYSAFVIGLFNAAPRFADDPPDAMGMAGIIWMTGSAFSICFMALSRLRGYWRGFFQFLVAILCMELLYYAPIIGDWMRDFSEYVSQQNSAD